MLDLTAGSLISGMNECSYTCVIVDPVKRMEVVASASGREFVVVVASNAGQLSIDLSRR